jgi:hypothetical protein
MTTQPDDSHPLLRQTRDNWVDEAIREARKRGEFDKLTGEGKPLDLTANPHGADWEMAHRILKNAGFAPEWIELDKAIRAETAALAVLRDRTAGYLRAYRTPGESSQVMPDELSVEFASVPARGRLRRILQRKQSSETRLAPQRHDNRQWLEAERLRARREYLQRTADLDRKIGAFNSALPQELWWKARPRLPLERAEQDFDRSCPPVEDAQ